MWLFCYPMDHSHASLSMGFPRQVYWSGLPFPSLGDLSDSGIKPVSPAKPIFIYIFIYTGDQEGKESACQWRKKTINLAHTCIPNTIFCCLRQSIWFSSPSGCHFLLPHWKPASAKAYVTTDLHRQNPLCRVVSTAMGELRAGFVDSAPSTVRGSPLPHLE